MPERPADRLLALIPPTGVIRRSYLMEKAAELGLNMRTVVSALAELAAARQIRPVERGGHEGFRRVNATELTTPPPRPTPRPVRAREGVR